MRRRWTVRWYPEICCELCNEVIHNHFECPKCGHRYVGTSYYIDVRYDLEQGEDTFVCESGVGW